jgi:hypothetical protein
MLQQNVDSKKSTDLESLIQQISQQAPEIGQAYALAAATNYSPAELEAYDRYWDVISSERTLLEGKYDEGLAEGEAKGRAEEKAALRAKLTAKGMSEEQIQELLGE